jgi:hypothetical protein
MVCLRGWVLAFLLIVSMAVPASAANWLEQNFWMSGPRYDSRLPSCEAGLPTIAGRFATKEARFWNSSLSIQEFARVRETALRPWAEQTIPRRFCSAEARISDGKWRTVHYVIAEDTSLIGLTWDVEWCVVGLDRNWAYAPGCKMARP